MSDNVIRDVLILDSIIPLEEEEQAKVVIYLDELKAEGKKIKYTSIPNSTFTKSWKQKKKNKEQGLRAGLPDLFLIVNNRPFFIEMKRKSGKVSESQKEWIEAIKKCKELGVYVCYSYEQAKEIIDMYLNPTCFLDRIIKHNI